MSPTRDDAWDLLCEWTSSESLRRHGLAVEAAVGWYAEHHFGAGRRGPGALAHGRPSPRLRLRAVPGDAPAAGCGGAAPPGLSRGVVDAVLGHGDHTGQPRTSDLAHTVYACDEMSGFVVAVALVRPNRSLDEVDVEAVRKKMKDKGFARQVPRDQLVKGADELSLPLEDHIGNVIAGLRTVGEELGL